MDNIPVCAACGKKLVGTDYDEAHWEHEPDCPRYNDDEQDQWNADTDCDCDLWYHAACCPRCNA